MTLAITRSDVDWWLQNIPGATMEELTEMERRKDIRIEGEPDHV